MAHTSEIEKLERRYAENPKGRNFAPLADAYRKAGQLDQAIELCTSGLQHHPDYVSAHIVYGRCLIDQHSDDNAAVVFHKVLELDPENVIAFKALAEISARSERLDEAVAWLTKLLAADPMNGDAAEALAVAKGKASQAGKATTPVTPVAPPVAALMPDLPDIILDPEPVQATDLSNEAKRASGIEVFDGHLDLSAVADSTARADGIELQEDVVLQPTELEVEGLARSQYEGSGMFKLDTEPEEEDLATVDLPLIMPEPEEEGVAASAAPAGFEVPAEPVPERATLSERRTSRPSGGTPAAVPLSDDDGAADTAALSRAEPVVTETMAELFLKQGHQEEALRVYQALQAQRPDDRRLRAKVEALSRGTVRDWGEGTIGGPGVQPSGQTAQAFLQGILANRPGGAATPELVASPPLDEPVVAAAPDPGPRGEATHAASDDLSLDQVFGDEETARPAGGAATAPRPDPPAGAAPPPAAPGGFSFDEFFSAGGAPESSGSPAASNAGSQASGSRAKPPVEEDVDLDQFQSWLKGLKS